MLSKFFLTLLVLSLLAAVWFPAQWMQWTITALVMLLAAGLTYEEISRNPGDRQSERDASHD